MDFIFDPGKGYYESKKIVSDFNNNYIQYESMGDKDKNLSLKKYLDDIINNHKSQGKWRIHSGKVIIKHETQGEWKIHLTMAINFISSKEDSDEIRTLHAPSDNIEIMLGSATDEIIEELFETFLQIYQEGFEELMRGSEFIFDSVYVVYYNLDKTSLSKGGSYIDSPKWLKNKKATIDPKNNDDKYLQYILTVALNYQNIKNNPERISKITPYIDQYNWKEINFPSHKKDWKKFE